MHHHLMWVVALIITLSWWRWITLIFQLFLFPRRQTRLRSSQAVRQRSSKVCYERATSWSWRPSIYSTMFTGPCTPRSPLVSGYWPGSTISWVITWRCANVIYLIPSLSLLIYLYLSILSLFSFSFSSSLSFPLSLSLSLSLYFILNIYLYQFTQ